jgi:ABC-type transporter Mla subunit MlaD
VQKLIDTLDKDTHELTQNVNYAAKNFGDTMNQSNAMLLENRRNLLELLKNLKSTTENLKEFSEDVKRNPWKLVRKSDEEPAMDPQALPASGNTLRMQRRDKVPD